MKNKMTKEERDSYVLENHERCSNKEVAETTGWSMTTIKSVKRRLNLVKSERAEEIKNYLLEYPDVSYLEASYALGAKIDNVRDIAKALGRTNVSYADRGFSRLVSEFEGRFIFERSEYSSNKDKINATCSTCGNVITRRGMDMLQNGMFCEYCEPRDSRDTFVYILELQETMAEEEIGQFKVGVSCNVKSRVMSVKSSGKLGHLEIVDTVACPSRDVALSIERAIHKKLKNFQVYGDLKVFDGSTEIFETSLDRVLEALRASFRS